MFLNHLDAFLSLAEKTQAEPTWSQFTRYLHLHGRGVRKEALTALGIFLDAAQLWPFEARYRLVHLIVNALPREAIIEPLLSRLVIPTLQDWHIEAPDNAEANLYLGLIGRDNCDSYLRRALELDPECNRSRATLSQWLIGDVDYHQHELPALYINDPRIDLLDLAEAAALWKGFEDTDVGSDALAEITEYRRAAEAWLKDHPGAGDFAV